MATFFLSSWVTVKVHNRIFLCPKQQQKSINFLLLEVGGTKARILHPNKNNNTILAQLLCYLLLATLTLIIYSSSAMLKFFYFRIFFSK
jgi:hypothetical protein